MTGRMDCRARRASRTLTVRRRESVRRLVPEHRPPRGGDRADRDQQRDEAARGLRARRQRTPGARRVPNRVIAGPEARQMGSRHSEIDDRDCDARDRKDDETDRDRCHQATRNHGSKATDRWSSDVCARRRHVPRSGADLVVLRGDWRAMRRGPSRPRENRCRRSRCRSCSSRGHPWDSSRNCRSQWCRSCSSRGHPWTAPGTVARSRVGRAVSGVVGGTTPGTVARTVSGAGRAVPDGIGHATPGTVGATNRGPGLESAPAAAQQDRDTKGRGNASGRKASGRKEGHHSPQIVPDRTR